MSVNTRVIHIDGHEISATFTEVKNETADRHIKQLLLSSFANQIPDRCNDDNLVIPSKKRYNRDSDRHYVP